MGDADRRLAEARARVRELSAAMRAAQGFGDWDGLRAADQEMLAAEREVARIAGDEYAEDLDFELAWSTGAPLPHVLANGHRTFLLFYLADSDSLGVVEFRHVHSVKLGGPNDEAIEGHPLSGKGLRAYAAHKVVNSRWIAEAERINSVHPQHRGGWHDRLNHYVFCFHDETFECLAGGFTAERCVGSPRAVLAELVNRVLA
jgi:hypothetical protein